METLTDLLTSGAAPWWAVPVGLAAGVLLGVFATRIGARPSRRAATVAAPLRAADRALQVRFLHAADSVYNHLFEADHSALAEADLAEALQSDDLHLRSVARGIVDLDAIVNEMRLSAPEPVLAAAVALFGYLTAVSSDGTDDLDEFRDRYLARKSAFVDAVRAAHPPAGQVPA
ncbi:hypothetical protein [Rhodococcus ruber]|uniref:hypothetical protein n=1 Tax=Rhodococcus ruber TaxID=1830 RepID=UPI003D819D78